MLPRVVNREVSRETRRHWGNIVKPNNFHQALTKLQWAGVYYRCTKRYHPKYTMHRKTKRNSTTKLNVDLGAACSVKLERTKAGNKANKKLHSSQMHSSSQRYSLPFQFSIVFEALSHAKWKVFRDKQHQTMDPIANVRRKRRWIRSRETSKLDTMDTTFHELSFYRKKKNNEGFVSPESKIQNEKKGEKNQAMSCCLLRGSFIIEE